MANMPCNHFLWRSLLACCLLMAGVTRAELPKPFEATYEARYGSLSITATRTLRELENGGQELRFAARSWLARIEEVSQFNWNREGHLVPERYSYSRTGLGRDREAHLDFDWQKLTVVNNVQKRPWSMSIPPQAMDKLSYQLQLRHDLLNRHTRENDPELSYAIADGGRLKTYRFEVLGEEQLQTAVGRLNVVKVRKVREGSKRVTLLWLARDWDHLVVRIQQTEKDGKHYEINLASASLNGIPVTGL
ncbi:DUF3108 domain-containing protein [Pseudomaricurvus alkylphenolicus]|uniref:DUF3108 domain-containing protein n=1 Tax=Pseudomaricurvus alkylphenolicus TaxID=1306991 RepID=UPI001421F0FA|nr:DUF3108 domain-containing protein [Pseudomaricurvus alkylphenolicus]NIB41977.1 DUF3108 domain-containing protein [Pseudomaricurvus alkylphenolicus]